MKKIGSVVLLITMIATFILGGNVLAASSTTSGFSDVPSGAWYEETLQTVIDAGIISGYPDGTFRGEDEMTVDQFIKTMVVAIDGEQPLGTSYWASNYIHRAIELGLIEEDSFDNYEEVITRAEMAYIAKNTLDELEGEYDYQYGVDIKKEITDFNSVNFSGYLVSVLKMYERGIIKGYPDGNFKPNDGLKRQEAITVILRVIDASQRSSYEGRGTDLSEYSDEVQEWIQETGYLPFEDYQGIIVDDNELDERIGLGEGKDSKFPIGIYFGEVQAYSTTENYIFDMSISLEYIYESENPEATLEYVLYLAGDLLKERTHMSDENIAIWEERIKSDYAAYVTFAESGENIALGETYVYDTYGRFTIIGDKYLMAGYGITSITGWLTE